VVGRTTVQRKVAVPYLVSVQSPICTLLAGVGFAGPGEECRGIPGQMKTISFPLLMCQSNQPNLAAHGLLFYFQLFYKPQSLGKSLIIPAPD
jgi:hypothetical protein